MRGQENDQPSMFSYVSLEEWVPKRHPLRKIRGFVDEALERLSSRLDEI